MNSDNQLVKGYVIRNVPYGESDAIVSGLTEEGIISFKARGIKKITSKNASSCLLYAFSEFECATKGNYKYLTRGSLISSNYQLYEDIDKMCICGLISETILTFLPEPSKQIYILFEYLMRVVNGEFDLFSFAAIFIAKIIIECGYGLDVDGCVKCHTKNKIVSINYAEGGLICYKCRENENIESPLYLKTIRYIFKVDEENYFHHIIERPLAIRLIKELMNYLKNQYDYRKLVFCEMFFETY